MSTQAFEIVSGTLPVDNCDDLLPDEPAKVDSRAADGHQHQSGAFFTNICAAGASWLACHQQGAYTAIQWCVSRSKTHCSPPQNQQTLSSAVCMQHRQRPPVSNLSCDSAFMTSEGGSGVRFRNARRRICSN